MSSQSHSNSTFVRPAIFYLSGFSNIPHVKYFYVFLCFVYIMTVLGNGFLLSLIWLVKTLHTPKYMIVFNMALTDLCGSTALIPKLLDTFLFDRRYIVYEACVQSWTLVTMAYDRLIAIFVGLINRLSFCDSVVVKSFFCDHGPYIVWHVMIPSLNIIMANVVVSIGVFIPLIFISCTYVCISIALSKIASGEERLKALKTCTNIAVWTSYIHPNARIINSTLTHTLPALINPIVYALKTEEVMNAVKKLWKINNIRSPVTKW
uniref:G-protein coupled receptors family 1 profile domain-containing protein n=1 Tax=Maylandia zebra TaxID=106582 RepID=A0A3P9DFI4_9CICH